MGEELTSEHRASRKLCVAKRRSSGKAVRTDKDRISRTTAVKQHPCKNIPPTGSLSKNMHMRGMNRDQLLHMWVRAKHLTAPENPLHLHWWPAEERSSGPMEYTTHGPPKEHTSTCCQYSVKVRQGCDIEDKVSGRESEVKVAPPSWLLRHHDALIDAAALHMPCMP